MEALTINYAHLPKKININFACILLGTTDPFPLIRSQRN